MPEIDAETTLQQTVEIYKTYVSALQSDLDRRLQIHRHYVVLISALLAAFIFLITKITNIDASSDIEIYFIVLIFCICVSWIFSVKRIRDITNIMTDVIVAMEEEIGLVKPYTMTKIHFDQKFIKNMRPTLMRNAEYILPSSLLLLITIYVIYFFLFSN